jgi:RNA polymerase sigma-70 factor (ECF subfamily)
MEKARAMKPIITDNQLMQMFAEDDDQYAFERLYHKYKDALIRFSFGYTFNQARAEEIVHDTFLKVHRYKKNYDVNKSFRTWLWTICKNTNLDSLDKNPKRREESIDELELDIPDVDESALEKLVNESSKEHIADIIKTLPLTQREALLLWMNDDLNFEEMGSILQKSPQAVKNLVHRAKASLKVKLGGLK